MWSLDLCAARKKYWRFAVGLSGNCLLLMISCKGMLRGELLCVFMWVRWSERGRKSCAICMGLMHGTPRRLQEQYNPVVKAPSQPFVCVVQWRAAASKDAQRITQFHKVGCWILQKLHSLQHKKVGCISPVFSSFKITTPKSCPVYMVDTCHLERQKGILFIIFTLFPRLWPTPQHPCCPGSRRRGGGGAL